MAEEEKSEEDLAEEAFTDEGLRRMLRKAAVASAAATGDLPVNDERRVLGTLMLRNIAQKAAIFAEYAKKQRSTKTSCVKCSITWR